MLGTDAFTKHVTDIEISSKESKLVSLRNPQKKEFHMLVFAGLFPCNDYDLRVWCDILNFEVDRKVYFINIYNYMQTKNECYLIWKIRHGAIPTGRFMYGCRYSDSPNCNHCCELDDLPHILFRGLIRKLT